MNIENELAEVVTIGDHEFEEVIEEYEEEVLVQEQAPEPPVTNFADTAPAEGKPRCITLILNDHWIYMMSFMLQAFYGNYMRTYIYLWVLLV